MNSPSPIDSAAINRLCRLGGNKFACEMIDLFLSFTGQKVTEARCAASSGNLAGVQKAAHPVKSSAGNVGATHLQRLAGQLESEALGGQAEKVLATLSEFEQAFVLASSGLSDARRKLVDPDANAS